MMHNPTGGTEFEFQYELRAGSAPSAAGSVEGPGHDAQARFHQSGYLALREISCEVQERTLVLRGSVPSYYQKQIAQSLAANVEGIERVCNYIEVRVRASGQP